MATDNTNVFDGPIHEKLTAKDTITRGEFIAMYKSRMALLDGIEALRGVGNLMLEAAGDPAPGDIGYAIVSLAQHLDNIETQLSENLQKVFYSFGFEASIH